MYYIKALILLCTDKRDFDPCVDTFTHNTYVPAPRGEKLFQRPNSGKNVCLMFNNKMPARVSAQGSGNSPVFCCCCLHSLIYCRTVILYLFGFFVISAALRDYNCISLCNPVLYNDNTFTLNNIAPV